jgi:hypothetical protein
MKNEGLAVIVHEATRYMSFRERMIFFGATIGQVHGMAFDILMRENPRKLLSILRKYDRRSAARSPVKQEP